MATLIFTSLLAIVGSLVIYLLVRLFQSKEHELPLPPGPKGLPLLGNVNDLPKPGMTEWQHWLPHKDLYGPISSVTVLGQTFIIIHDADIALQVLRDRANVHSGRPVMMFGGEMIGWKNTLAMQQPDETFKLYRKNMAKVASSAATLSVFDRVQEEESAHFLSNMLESPDKLFDHIRMEAGAVILRITYGYTPKSNGKDPLVDLVGQAMSNFADATTPGKYLVDVFPFLRYLPEWLPGTGFQEKARRLAKHLDHTAGVPYEFVKQQMRENKHKTSYVSQFIGDVGSDAYLEHVLKWSATSLYTGGADTTVSSLMTFFLAMALFPGVQKKAQEEIDRVIGNNRLPVSSDKDSLPYIWATVKETHRWYPVVPMAIPHCASEDDTIRGYRIPKGSILIPNTWWFTHNPAVYPEPEQFNPDRFLTSPPNPDPRTYTFGYGRRVCPGRYVADNALIITIAQVLAVFDISTHPDEPNPVPAFEPGIVSHPLPYRVRVKSRNEGAERLIRRSGEVWPLGRSDEGELVM
ncbi:cytochrome P450 [Phaeosphaeriaceae sp. SRC1lsM3a]|nr:cytochrome P450 [Stagonospora sp. SRC1lsM3a]